MLQLGAYTGQDCQQFHLDRASDGCLVFASLNGNRVVEVPFASANPDVQLNLFDYNGCACQHWFLSAAGPLATAANHLLAGASICPVPAVRGAFTLDLSGRQSAEAVTMKVLDPQGRSVYRRVVAHTQATVAVDVDVAPGLFLVRVQQGNGLLTQKLTIL